MSWFGYYVVSLVRPTWVWLLDLFWSCIHLYALLICVCQKSWGYLGLLSNKRKQRDWWHFHSYIWLHQSIYSKNSIGLSLSQRIPQRKTVQRTTGVTNKTLLYKSFCKPVIKFPDRCRTALPDRHCTRKRFNNCCVIVQHLSYWGVKLMVWVSIGIVLLVKADRAKLN